MVDSRDDQCWVLVQNIVGSEREPHAPIGPVVALISSMEEEGERQTKDSRIYSAVLVPSPEEIPQCVAYMSLPGALQPVEHGQRGHQPLEDRPSKHRNIRLSTLQEPPSPCP
jgi:hypothetical protein